MSEYSMKLFDVDTLGTDETIAEIESHQPCLVPEKYDVPMGSICFSCVHFDKNNYLTSGKHKCSAFEDIPIVIWKKEIVHDKPYPNDKGFRFEKKPTIHLP